MFKKSPCQIGLIDQPQSVHKIKTTLFSVSLPKLLELQSLALESTNYDYESAEYKVTAIILDTTQCRLFTHVHCDLFTQNKSNNTKTKLYDKRDTFGFHIVNFPFMSSNIPSALAYGVYASQLIRYAHCCSNYNDFLLRHRALVTKLLSQGYKVDPLSKTFKKVYGRHMDLVRQYKKNVCQMFADFIS